jgi:hypothetical protein
MTRERMTPSRERNCCYRRKPLHVFEPDRQGYYTVEVYDPIGSVISYLRNERWNEAHGRNEAERIYGLLTAIDVCNSVANDNHGQAPDFVPVVAQRNV